MHLKIRKQMWKFKQQRRERMNNTTVSEETQQTIYP